MNYPWAVAFLAFVVLVGGCSGGEDPAGESGNVVDEPAQEPVVEAKVIEILEGLSKLLRESKSYRLNAEVTTEEFLSSGQTVELSRNVTLTVRRSGGIFIDRNSEEFHRQLYFDGKTVSIHDVDENVYATKSHPGTNDELFTVLQEKYGATLPLVDLAVEDPKAALSENAAWGLYLGPRMVRGIKCHHLLLSSGLLEWQVWVQADGDPIPRKIVIHHGDEPGEPRYRAEITKWEKDIDVTDEMLRFTPTDDAREIELVRSDEADGE